MEASVTKTYEVEVLKTRFWTGTLPPRRLASMLSDRASGGWSFRHSITVYRRVLLVFKRESYYLIFEREGA